MIYVLYSGIGIIKNLQILVFLNSSRRLFVSKTIITGIYYKDILRRTREAITE